MVKIILPLILASTISFIMTPLARKFARNLGAIDIPKDKRRVHKKPTPLLGGLAIYISVVLCLVIFVPITQEIISIIIGGTIILISGILDDWKDLSPRLKTIFQIIAALVLVMGDIRIEFIKNPFAQGHGLVYLRGLSIPATIFWVVGITNTLNLIDGLDGLAVGVAAISSLSFTMVASDLGYDSIMTLSIILAGASFGFLPHNFNPATIFLGDTGALFLGFMLAAISIEGVMKSVATIAIIVPILILGIPIFDTTFAIFRRLKSGRSITSADKGHLHHVLLKKGLSQRKIVLILFAISGFFGAYAVLIARLNTNQGVYLSLLFLIVALIYGLRIGMFGNQRDKVDER